MKNILLLLVSLAFSLLLVEAGLRTFTPFPVNQSSNREHDPVLGYRFSTQLNDIDEHGFRNTRGKQYRIAAIGDSHTYGINVTPEKSWPALLESMTGSGVYNFGVGSYGIFSYHAIIRTLLHPDTEAVIIGLYVANDFELDYSYCQIDTENNSFWQKEAESLNLHLPAVTYCKNRHLKKNKTTSLRSVKKWLFENTALLNAIDILVVSRIRQPEHQGKIKKYYQFPETITPVAKGRTRGHARTVDLDDPAIAAMFENLEIFIESWSEWSQSRGIILGVMFIPSLEQVVYEYFKRKNMLDQIDPDFTRDVSMQFKMDNRIAEILDKYGLPHKNALDRVVTAYQKSLQAGNDFYPINNGHPYEDGYTAYAETAFELWNDMNMRSK